MVRQSKKLSGNFRKLIKKRLDKTNPLGTELTAEEKKRLVKLEAIAEN
jgi:hypothetical protein